jgi:hypothetical protein
MPRYLLLKHYRGGPEPHRPYPPMDQWAPEDVEAHIAFQRHVSELLEDNGEYVDAQARSRSRLTSPPSPARAGNRCMSGSTSGRSCPRRPRTTDPGVIDEETRRALALLVTADNPDNSLRGAGVPVEYERVVSAF